MIWVQFGAVALFALLACTNVAGLLLARGADRQRELAVRAALGAGRLRLLRQLLVETTLLAGLAALLAVALSAFALQAIRALGPAVAPRLDQARLDGSTWLVTLGLGSLVALLCGLAPALAGVRRSVQARLGQGNRTTTVSKNRRGILVGAQAALAMTLVIGAALLFRSLLALASVDPGFDAERLLIVRPALAGGSWSDDRLAGLFADITGRLQALPGVESAGATNVTPFGSWSTAIQYRRSDSPQAGSLLQANWRTVTPGFFRTMGIAPLRGRVFDERDTADTADVVVITKDLAEQTWPGEDPIGRQVVWGRTGPPKTVIGVVPPVRDHVLDRDPQPTMFRAFAQLPLPDMTVAVRTSGDPATLVPDVRDLLGRAWPDVAVAVQPLSAIVADVLLRPRVNAVLVGTFAGLALIVAAVGLYATVNYTVRQRRRELAIRSAFGAPASSVLGAVLGRSLAWTMGGALVGVAGGLLLARGLAALLYDTRATDVAAYLWAALLLAGVAAVAAVIPARRALGIDPVAVLRHE